MKRIIPVIMSILLLLLSVTACSQKPTTMESPTPEKSQPVETSTPEKSAEATQAVQSPASSTTPEAMPKEHVDLTVAWNEVWPTTSTDKNWPEKIAADVMKKLNVSITIEGMDDTKYKVLLAGGDLPDMVFVTGNTPVYMKQLIESQQVIPLDDLIKTNGQEIEKNIPERLAFCKKYMSNNTDKTYFITTNAGKAAPPFTNDLGYILRWDYYKELGYPKFTSQMEELDILAQMQKSHPTTTDGKKVYGMGYFNDWGLWAYKINCYREGYYETSYHGYVIGMDDNKILPTYTSPNSPMWSTINYMYKANKMGLLDPDSFTMKQADYMEKINNGQYLTCLSNWWLGNFNEEQIKADPNTDKGYVVVPVEGSGSWNNGVSLIGTAKLWSISSNCKTPDRAMDFINYLYSPDGVRQCWSGTKGEEWDIIDGKPNFKPETIAIFNGDIDTRAKVGFGMFNNNLGLGGGTICSDGGIADLSSTPEMLKLRVKGVLADFCKYYQVDYPNQVFDKMVSEGKMIDLSKGALNDATSLMQGAPDDIKRINTKMDDLVTKYIPKIVLSKTDAEMEANSTELIAQLKAAGSEQSDEFWAKAWEDAKAAYTSTSSK